MVLDDSCGATIELLCWRPTLPKPTKNAMTIRPESPSFECSEAELVSQDTAYTGVTGTGRTVNLKGYDIGAVVKVKGGLSIYRGEKQIMLERICTFYRDSPNFHHPTLLLLLRHQSMRSDSTS